MSMPARTWPPGPTRRPAAVPEEIMAGDTDGRPHRVRVLVLAADPARAASVRRGLEGHSAIEVVGAVRHADAAVVACARHRIDVVVAVSEAQATETRLLQRAVAIRSRYPATRVVVALGSEQRMWDTLLARPDGLLTAAASSQEIHAVVGSAAAGHLTIGRSLREAFFEACAPASEQPDTALEDLTPREVEIISAGARGLTLARDRESATSRREHRGEGSNGDLPQAPRPQSSRGLFGRRSPRSGSLSLRAGRTSTSA